MPTIDPQPFRLNPSSLARELSKPAAPQKPVQPPKAADAGPPSGGPPRGTPGFSTNTLGSQLPGRLNQNPAATERKNQQLAKRADASIGRGVALFNKNNPDSKIGPLTPQQRSLALTSSLSKLDRNQQIGLTQGLTADQIRKNPNLVSDEAIRGRRLETLSKAGIKLDKNATDKDIIVGYNRALGLADGANYESRLNAFKQRSPDLAKLAGVGNPGKFIAQNGAPDADPNSKDARIQPPPRPTPEPSRVQTLPRDTRDTGQTIRQPFREGDARVVPLDGSGGEKKANNAPPSQQPPQSERFSGLA